MAIDDAALVTTPAHLPGKGREFFGHPRGLLYVAGTEFWDRVSFHGMQALLVLYMVEYLLLPGHAEHVAGLAGLRAVIESVTGPLSAQAFAAQIFGLYVGFVYLLCVGGGLLGDRVLGRRLAVTLGALLMAVGHFCMAFERAFLAALLLIILGAALLRGNLPSQMGAMYGASDPRRANAFQIYYAVLNTGAFVAPLITGTLAQAYGWHYGFTFAGFGMLIGVVIYVIGARYLPPDAPRRIVADRARLRSDERRVVWVLMLLLPALTLFWVMQTQIWNTYNVWARDHVDLMIGGWKMPVPWLQSVDSLAVVVIMPPLLRYWRWQAALAREPDDVAKLAQGCLLFAAAIAWLACGRLVADAQGKVPLAWAFGYHFLSAVGYLYVAPTAVALYSRAAPAAVNAMMIGAYYLAIFAGSVLSGRLGGFYERLSPAEFWLLHAAIGTLGGSLIFLFAAPLRRTLVPRPAT